MVWFSVKHLQGNIRTVVAQVEPVPARERDINEENQEARSPPTQDPAKPVSSQSSPGNFLTYIDTHGCI